MNDGFHAAASYMGSVMRKLELAASDAANAQTPGYKPRILETSSFETALDRALGRDPSLIGVREVTDLSQGQLVPNASKTAIALDGDGFFAVDTPSGVRFTRNGDFVVDRGGTLRTRGGYAVLGDGGPLTADPASVDPVRIDARGDVYQGDRLLGRVRVVAFDDPSALVREGDTLFAAPAGTRPVERPVGTRIVAGALELPPEAAVSGLVSMIVASRGFETAQRAIRTLGDSYEQLLQGS